MDANDLQSFMRTAQLLEISSLCDSVPHIPKQDPPSLNNLAFPYQPQFRTPLSPIFQHQQLQQHVQNQVQKQQKMQEQQKQQEQQQKLQDQHKLQEQQQQVQFYIQQHIKRQLEALARQNIQQQEDDKIGVDDVSSIPEDMSITAKTPTKNIPEAINDPSTEVVSTTERNNHQPHKSIPAEIKETKRESSTNKNSDSLDGSSTDIPLALTCNDIDNHTSKLNNSPPELNSNLPQSQILRKTLERLSKTESDEIASGYKIRHEKMDFDESKDQKLKDESHTGDLNKVDQIDSDENACQSASISLQASNLKSVRECSTDQVDDTEKELNEEIVDKNGSTVHTNEEDVKDVEMTSSPSSKKRKIMK